MAVQFGVAKSFVQKLLSMNKTQGHVQPRKQGGAMKAELDGQEELLRAMVAKYPDATLQEYCEYWGTTYVRIQESGVRRRFADLWFRMLMK